MTVSTYLVLAVEDELSATVLRRLLRESKREFIVDRVIVERGYGRIKAGIPKYKTASRAVPHVLLTDLDRYQCAIELLQDWKATKLPSSMLLRIAVREVEAWLLADRAGIAEFLRVPIAKVPSQPENLPDPKQAMVNLARKSQTRRFVDEMVPSPGSAAAIGPLYNAHLSGFAQNRWDVAAARDSAESLNRALSRISGFMAG